jgi:hypothetical protein
VYNSQNLTRNINKRKLHAYPIWAPFWQHSGHRPTFRNNSCWTAVMASQICPICSSNSGYEGARTNWLNYTL